MKRTLILLIAGIALLLCCARSEAQVSVQIGVGRGYYAPGYYGYYYGPAVYPRYYRHPGYVPPPPPRHYGPPPRHHGAPPPPHHHHHHHHHR